MKIVLIGPYREFGGVSRYVKDLLEASSDFRLFDTARPEKKKIRAGTGYVEAFNAGLGRFLRGLYVTLKNIVRFPFFLMKSDANIVHVCGVSFFPFWENATYMIMAKLLGKKVTLHYLGAFDQFYEPAGLIQKLFIRTVMKIPDSLILLSEKVKEMASSFLPESKLSVLPSSVDTDRFNAPDRKFPVFPNHVRILFVGGLDPFRKGVYDLLDSFKKVLEECPDTVLVMTGGGSFAEVRRKWKKLGLNANIEFLGWFDEDELPNLYASCDILVLPSYNEGLPYVVIEALSSGLPILSTSVGGIPEVVKNTENGFIVSPGDIHALTSALLKLVQNDSLRARISSNNRNKAIECYSIYHVIGELNRIFSEISGDTAG